MRRNVFLSCLFIFMLTIFTIANASILNIFKGKSEDPSSWPNRAVTFSVPGNAGGGSDLTARYLTRAWEDSYKINFSVMNFPSTEASFQNVSNQKSDGINIGLAHSAIMTQYVTGGSKLNPLEDLTIIAAVGNNGLRSIAARVDAPFNTIQEMIDYAKANPNTIKVGTSPNGTVKFLIGRLENIFGIKFRPVEASQETDRLTNLAGGFIDVGTVSLSNGIAYEKAEKLKVLGTIGADQAVISDFMENAPENFKTLQEMGYEKAYAVTNYYVIGPKNMDSNLVQKINDSLKNVANINSGYIKGMKDMGQVGEWFDVTKSQKIYADDLNTTTETAKALGIYNIQK